MCSTARDVRNCSCRGSFKTKLSKTGVSFGVSMRRSLHKAFFLMVPALFLASFITPSFVYADDVDGSDVLIAA